MMRIADATRVYRDIEGVRRTEDLLLRRTLSFHARQRATW